MQNGWEIHGEAELAAETALDSDELRSIVLWKMENYTAEEIAEKLGCVERTVERKLALVRTIWSQELPA